MTRLPVDEWKVHIHDTCIAVAAHVGGPEGDTLVWTRVELANLPKNLVSLDDLKLLLIDFVDGAAADPRTNK